ncbi:MAG: cation:proton antiporter [Nitriliruptoraceae bacterium]|nr:cation:proton antiporter [Nitriliruptoraceae bacterium]
MDLLGPFALVALVLLAAALAAGLVDRAPLSFPILFLGLGLGLGPGALDVVRVELDAPVVAIIAITTLSLVLFLDAVNLDLAALRHDWLTPAITLGPGTLLTIAGITLAAVVVVGLPWPSALVAGAALASTDAVTLRDVLRDQRLPGSVRRTLAVEAGTNDVIVLPVLLLTVALATGGAQGPAAWVGLLGQLLVLSPLAGGLVGWASAQLMGRVDRIAPIRTEYQSIYGIGLVLTSYVAGEAVGGSGFVAAFAAGVAVSVSNESLCDCFLELGQTLVEVLLLAAFVLFGAVLSGLFTLDALLPGIGLGLLVLIVIRPAAVGGVLVVRRTRLSAGARLAIGWFGPRGLASLLLALLAVQAGVPGATALFVTVGAVVATSVLLHGTTVGAVAGAYDRRYGASVQPEDRDGGLGVLRHGRDEVPRIEADELREALRAGRALVVDARAEAGRRATPRTIAGGRWIPPDQLDVAVETLPSDRIVATWCTCPQDATAARSAGRLRARGLDARVLRGGLEAARAAGLETEAVTDPTGATP